VVEATDLPSVTIGVAARGFPLNRQPGTMPDSYGYRALDGEEGW
jgi:hypothetical protein